MIVHNWKDNYRNIPVSYEDRVVRVKICDELKQVFREEHRSCPKLMDAIFKTYEEETGKKLDITRSSLACELRIHVWADRFFIKWEHRFRKVPGPVFRRMANFCHRMHVHTETIDCGERAIDNNRFIFDWLSVFYREKKSGRRK